jgi:hypothetical protein
VCAIGNSDPDSQQQYEMALTARGNGRILLKISAPQSLMTTYRMNLISAGSMSLEDTSIF